MTDVVSLPSTFRPYSAPPGFGVITSYFNPDCYRSKLHNYLLFRESLRASNMSCLTVECLFPGQRSELPPAADIHTVVARDTMWQKERLLNIAIAHAPAEWETVAWLDCDVFFENHNWAIDAVSQLRRHAVVQVFSDVVRLPEGATWGRQGEEQWKGFALIAKKNPLQLLKGDFARHGHTGFGWAAHRELLSSTGLYDGCIAGSADHMMAHAFAGDWSGDCIDRILGANNPHRAHFSDWAEAVYAKVRAKISYVPGTLFHLWHGDMANRRYVLRNQQLSSFTFNPLTDVRIGTEGCWEWASDKPALHAWAESYFEHRKEDGDDSADSGT